MRASLAPNIRRSGIPRVQRVPRCLGEGAAEMNGSANGWLTFVLPVWVVCGIAALFQWLFIRRMLRKPRASPDMVLAGRRLYEDGEFKREIVERIPRGLFDDEVGLACGHDTTTM